jgi:asparagine synthase (glutamine-hydrolysing)
MCGIAGFIGSGSEQLLESMLEAIRHRGPDGEGHYVSPDRQVWLGHRRLAVIDINGGNQPMSNKIGNIQVTFNGEIYNHHELRIELEARGHLFLSDHSDTEVLVHGYEEWGDDLPLRLNGMFAFVIYDEKRQRLFVARDRFGKKPFFYSDWPGGFAFSSELTSLLCHPAIDTALDERALMKYFAYALFPAPHTPYIGVRKLPAGHSLVYTLEDNSTRISQYWSYKIQPETSGEKHTEARLAEELRSLLEIAVTRRLESDVPLGVLLSGGIDSSAIVALAAQSRSAEDIRTFSIGFEEETFDESRYARQVANQFGTIHKEKIFNFSTAKTMLPGLLSRLDEPLGDSSILPTYLLCEFARTDVTVALSGDGGDEMFAGYDPFKALSTSQAYQKYCPKPLHPAIEAIANFLPVSDKNMSFEFKLKRWLRGVGQRDALWGPVWMGALGPKEIGELFDSEIDIEDLYSEAIECWDGCASENIVDRMSEFFARFYLQDGVLLKSDRASMLSSLELRSPFLDQGVVEFSQKLPADLKLRNGETKYILKKALSGLVPDSILYRRKKGFGMPLAKWLRGFSSLEINSHKALSFASSHKITAMWEQHQSSKADYRHALWCLITLQGRF